MHPCRASSGRADGNRGSDHYGFFLAIEARDPKFDLAATAGLLRSLPRHASHRGAVVRNRFSHSPWLLAMVMLWAYVAFSQWMLTWTANVPDEIAFYLPRLERGWKWVGAAKHVGLTLTNFPVCPRMCRPFAGPLRKFTSFSFTGVVQDNNGLPSAAGRATHDATMTDAPPPCPRARIKPSRWPSLAWQRCRAGWNRLRRPDSPPKKQLVICGYPRSGTSLLYNMLSATLDGFRFPSFETPALDSLWRHDDVVSKMPLDVLAAPQLPAANIHGKQVSLLIVVRDLRDVLTSVHPRIPDRYFIGYQSQWRKGRGIDAEVDVYPVGIRHIHDAIVRAERLPEIGRIVVHYERLVAAPDRVQRDLADQLGLRFARPFSEFHRFGQRHAYRYEGDLGTGQTGPHRENSAVDTSRVGKWRDSKHARRIVEQFTSHPELFALLRHYGYERDDRWFVPYSSGRDVA